MSGGAAAGAVWLYQARATAAARPGSLTIQTSPAGLEVLVAGVSKGQTPLTISLPAGTHAVQVGDSDRRRDFSADIVAGGSLVHQFEFAPAPVSAGASARPTGALFIQTDPVRLSVLVDDVDRGLSPVTIADLSAGDHQVVVKGQSGVVRRTVKITPQETLSLLIAPIAPVAPAAITPGWLALSAPITLQLRQGGRLIGTTETERLMLPSGEHEIELVNEALGYRTSRKIAVVAGQTTSVRVEVPSGSLSINALPWAEVWVGGERIGETPIANLSRTIGSYEVVFRHPQLGERRENVVVTLQQPARLGVDMRR